MLSATPLPPLAPSPDSAHAANPLADLSLAPADPRAAARALAEANFSPLDRQRIKAWFDYDLRLPDLASELNTTVHELALWADQPHIRAFLDQIQRMARQRTQTLLAEAQHAAIARMVEIIRHGHNDETMRRAADRILRPSLRDRRDQPSPTILSEQRFHHRATVSIHKSPDLLPAEGRAPVGLAEISEPPTSIPTPPRADPHDHGPAKAASPQLHDHGQAAPRPNTAAQPAPPTPPAPTAPACNARELPSPINTFRATEPRPALHLAQQSGKAPHGARDESPIPIPRHSAFRPARPSRAPP